MKKILIGLLILIIIVWFTAWNHLSNFPNSISNGKPYYDDLQNVMKTISDFNDANYRGSFKKLSSEIELLEKMTVSVSLSQATNIDSIMKFGQQVDKKLVQFKMDEFPKMRKDVFNILKQGLWEEDIKAHLSGKRNEIIEFVGGTFAANRNIKTTMETISESMHLYRFKKVIFRWYSEGDGTKYKISSQNDNE